MDESIISRESMRQRGAAAFNAGRARESHGMNPWAPAVTEWLQGYDRAAQAWHRQQRGPVVCTSCRVIQGNPHLAGCIIPRVAA